MSLEEIYDIDQQDENKALGALYGAIYDILVKGDQSLLDDYLDDFLKTEFSTLLLAGFARITKPHKAILNNRKKLIDKLEARLSVECSKEEAANVLLHVS